MNRIDCLQFNPLQFRPDTHHDSVDAVMKDPNLSDGEKRAILSAWASDMYAVESSPGLRKIPGHDEAVPLQQILTALRGLDNDDPPPRGGIGLRKPARLSEETHATPGERTHRPIPYRVAHPRGAPAFRANSIRVRRNNLRRYHRLLATDLTALERDYIHRRIAEGEGGLSLSDSGQSAAISELA